MEGTSGNDLMMAVAAVVTGLPGDLVSNDLVINALGGDDAIVRDRTGSYSGVNRKYKDTKIDGGTGYDILNYNSADGPITARLDQTWTQVDVGGNSVWVQSASGWSLITSPALPIPSENNWVRGVDAVKSIEGIAGTQFDDALYGNGAANKLWGHDGNDTIFGNGGADSLWGGSGNDGIYGGSGTDVISGESGNDRLYGGTGRDKIYGGDGNDEIWGEDGNDELHGGAGNDIIVGGNGDDTIHAGDGHDEIWGGNGNDRIHTGDGADVVEGGAGRDRITVEGFGNKTIDGGDGIDTLIFTQKAVVNLHSGFATRGDNGVEGFDTISSVENVITDKFADVIVATEGANTVQAGDGDDWVMALGGDDFIYAGKGNDTVLGGDGDDIIWGGHGTDVIRGGEGADELRGNQPLGLASQIPIKDVLVWGEGDIGLDTVHNFSLAHDKLKFLDGFLAEGDVADNLLVFIDGTDAMLAANIEGHGWDFIGRFKDVNGIAMTNGIENGSIFDVQTTGVGGDVPGDFGGLEDADAIGIGLQIQF
jgi:Ca2+-binding RTX toxin-like protein